MLVRRTIEVVYNKACTLFLLKIVFCNDGILQFVAKLPELAFIKGNCFILVLSWIVMDFHEIAEHIPFHMQKLTLILAGVHVSRKR